jgi:O-antigen ligase
MMKVKDGTAPMISAWFVRMRRELAGYHPGTLVLATLPVTVAFGALVALPLGELHPTPTDALVASLVVLWIGPTPRPPPHLRMERGRFMGWMPYRALIIVLGALVGLMALSLLWATDRALAAKDALKWGEALAVILIAPRWLRRSRDARLVVGVMLAVALIEAGIGIAQGTLLAGALPVSADRGVRVVGTFGQPNPYAGYLNLTLPLLLAYVAWGRERVWRLRCAGLTLVLGCALALAQSRGATLALFVALLAMAWMGWPWARRWLVGAALAGVASIGLLLAIGRLTMSAFLAKLGWRPLTNAALSQHVTDANFSTTERLAHWAAALRMLAAHPWLGVGAGNYPIVYDRYAVPRWPLALGHAHNLYLNLAAELGILGGLLALAFASITIWLAVGPIPRPPPHCDGEGGTASEADRRVSSDLSPPALYGRDLSRPSTSLSRPALPSPSADGEGLGVGPTALLGVMVAVAVHNVFDDLTTHEMLVQQMLLLACGLGWAVARLNEVEWE